LFSKGNQLCKGIAVLTQLYCQIYINISTTLHVSALMAIVRLDTISEENRYNVIWYSTNISVV